MRETYYLCRVRAVRCGMYCGLSWRPEGPIYSCLSPPLDLHQVFCVNRSFLLVLVAMFSFLLVMFGEAVPYLPLKFLFL